MMLLPPHVNRSLNLKKQAQLPAKFRRLPADLHLKTGSSAPPRRNRGNHSIPRHRKRAALESRQLPESRNALLKDHPNPLSLTLAKGRKDRLRLLPVIGSSPNGARRHAGRRDRLLSMPEIANNPNGGRRHGHRKNLLTLTLGIASIPNGARRHGDRKDRLPLMPRIASSPNGLRMHVTTGRRKMSSLDCAVGRRWS
jgi:hypothetical protein